MKPTKSIGVALLALSASTAAANAQSATRATLDSMITFFAGRWSCEGQFANGRPLAADVMFAAALDNRWLSYSHADRAPGRFKMQAMWGYDSATRGLVSMAADNGSDPRLFRAPGWRDDAVVFERAGLGDSIPRPERFIYKRENNDTFRMTWEVSRDRATWLMGDFIVCRRAAAQDKP